MQSSTLARIKNQFADDKMHMKEQIDTLRNHLEYDRYH